MSMRKIFFGTIVFFSMAFLAACGGGGSGSSGATGATGAAGSAASGGAGTVPDADSDLSITYILDGKDGSGADAIDNNTSLGTITHGLKIVGMDNITAADSRVKYYVYEGSSATAKVVPFATNPDTVTGVTWASGVIEARNKTADNVTVVITDNAFDRANGLISHMILCPGNDAGDATTCASIDLKDRGARAADVIDLPFSGVDSKRAKMVLPASSSSGNAMYLVTDNATHKAVGSLTESKATHATYTSILTPTYSSWADIPDNMSADNLSDHVVGGSTIYGTVISSTDNQSILIASISSSGAVATYDTVAGTGSRVHSNNFQLSWNAVQGALYGAGTIYSTPPDQVALVPSDITSKDNRTVMTYALDGTSSTFSDNFTLDNVTNGALEGGAGGGAWCFAAGSPKWGSSTAAPAVVVVARNDNLSWTVMTDTASDGTESSNATPMSGTETLQDNGSVSFAPGNTMDIPLLATVAHDNVSMVNCDVAWNFSTSSSSAGIGQDNGTIHVAFQDNASAVRLGIIAQDNTTVEIGGILAGTGSGDITDIEIGVDSGDNMTVLAILKGGNYYLLKQYDNASTTVRTDTYDHNFATLISGTATGGSSDRISLNVAADGSAYAIAVDGANDNASIHIFYDQ